MYKSYTCSLTSYDRVPPFFCIFFLSSHRLQTDLFPPSPGGLVVVLPWNLPLCTYWLFTGCLHMISKNSRLCFQNTEQSAFSLNSWKHCGLQPEQQVELWTALPNTMAIIQKENAVTKNALKQLLKAKVSKILSCWPLGKWSQGLSYTTDVGVADISSKLYHNLLIRFVILIKMSIISWSTLLGISWSLSAADRQHSSV